MSDSSSEPCPTCGAALSVDRMGAYCPSCKHAIGEWRTEESSPLIAAVARLSAENEKLRVALANEHEDRTREYDFANADAEAAAKRIRELMRENAAMREILQAVGRGDMICAQEDFGTTPICVFGCDGHEDENEIGAFIHTSTCPVTKARALLATGEGEAKE